jgi:hypothetical protein
VQDSADSIERNRGKKDVWKGKLSKQNRICRQDWEKTRKLRISWIRFARSKKYYPCCD